MVDRRMCHQREAQAPVDQPEASIRGPEHTLRHRVLMGQGREERQTIILCQGTPLTGEQPHLVEAPSQVIPLLREDSNGFTHGARPQRHKDWPQEYR